MVVIIGMRVPEVICFDKILTENQTKMVGGSADALDPAQVKVIRY